MHPQTDLDDDDIQPVMSAADARGAHLEVVLRRHTRAAAAPQAQRRIYDLSAQREIEEENSIREP